jgi:hypothetical protein
MRESDSISGCDIAEELNIMVNTIENKRDGSVRSKNLYHFYQILEVIIKVKKDKAIPVTGPGGP